MRSILQHERGAYWSWRTGPARLALLAFLALLLYRKTVVLVRVVGSSMAPTLHHNDLVLGLRVPAGRGRIAGLIRRRLIARRGIVLVRLPGHSQRFNIKRIDGMPGELRAWGLEGQIEANIPEGHVFLIGDASASHQKRSGVPADSRLYGPIPTTHVIARIVLRCMPRARPGVLR